MAGAEIPDGERAVRELRALTGARAQLRERVRIPLLGLSGGQLAIIGAGVLVAVVAAVLLMVQSRPSADEEAEEAGATVVAEAGEPAAAPGEDEDAAGSSTARDGSGEQAGGSPDESAEGAAAGGATSNDAAADAGAETSETVLVHVAGKVHDPGVVVLPGGSRVRDAIEAAGGAQPGVRLRTVNLARVIADGEQVLVGLPPEEGAPAEEAGPKSGNGDPDGTAGEGADGGEDVVDLNSATREELETLPGVGPVLAQRLLDYRDEHGGYRAIDELLDVSGIGEARFADLESRVTLG